MKPLEPDAPCCIKGCGEPRKVSRSGVAYARCEEHQREYWRKNANRLYAASPDYRTKSIARKTAWQRANRGRVSEIQARCRQRRKLAKFSRILGQAAKAKGA